MKLAGTYQPLAYLVARAPALLPGIKHVAGTWYDPQKGLQFKKNDAFQVLNDDVRFHLQTWRAKQHSSYWVDSFEVQKSVATEQQLQIGQEEKVNTLLLCFDNIHDHKKDLLILTFPANFRIHALEQTFNSLSTIEKSLLNNLLFSIFQAEYKRVLDEQRILSLMATSNGQIKEDLSNAKSQLKQTEELYTSTLKTLSKEIVLEFEAELEVDITIEESFFYRLASESLNYKQVRQVLEDAIFTAFNLNIGAEKLHLTNEFLAFPKKNNNNLDDTTISDKVLVLLNRYESAAELAQKQGYTVNGKNVAAHLDPPITPPAITDALKKNEKRLRFLLEKYPKKWPLIKNGLKPLATIHEEVLKNVKRSA